MSQVHNECFTTMGSEETDDTREELHGTLSESGSSSGSDSDSDSSTSTTESSDDGETEKLTIQHSTPYRTSIQQKNEQQRHENSTKFQKSSDRDKEQFFTRAQESKVVSLPPQIEKTVISVKKTNGYSENDDEDEEDGTGDSDSQSDDSNSDSEGIEKSDAQAKVSERLLGKDSAQIQRDITNTDFNNTRNLSTSTTNTSTSSTTFNTSASSTTTTFTDHNTSRTNNKNKEKLVEDDDDEEDDEGEEESSSNDENENNTQTEEKTSTLLSMATTQTKAMSNKMNDGQEESQFGANIKEEDGDDNDNDDDEDDDDEGNGEDVSVSLESTKSSESCDESASASSSSSGSGSSNSNSSSDEDDEDDYQPATKRSTRPQRKAPSTVSKQKTQKKKKKSQNWHSDDTNGSEDESEPSSLPKRKQTARNQTIKLKKIRKKGCNLSDDSDGDSKRFGTRRTAAAVSYKEASEDEKTDSEDLLEVDESQMEATAAVDEEEEKSETIERILARRYGKKGCTGNQTTIYAIEENGVDPNEGVEDKECDDTEVQYLIKWKGWSHIHNTWESEETLREQKAKGMKKLDNFIKKEIEINAWRRYAGPEDIDYFECQLELQNDLHKSYNNVDRIIARNNKNDETCEYLCKWQSLPYSEATWEDATLVNRKWNRCVQQYEDREESKCTPSRHCRVLKYRPKFIKVKGQPEFLFDGLTLRDYQMDGLNWLLLSWCKQNSVILADEMGLGKTIQTICFLYSLFKTHNLYGPFLCVVPLSTMTAWQREFDLWAPEMNVVTYLGDVKSREMIRQYEWQFDGSKRLKFNCILTTYEIVLKDKFFLGTLQWAALLVDEAHRLKNDDSLLYKSLKEFDTNHRLLITGTPLQNSLKELWALLHFIMPEKFITWEDFELEHGNAADKGYTKLHQQLEPYILRRVKKDVEKSLPAKVEQILRVEMTSVQKQYYKWILTKNFDALRKGKKGSTSTFLNIVIELKKCCNHAALIRPSEFELLGMQQEEALQTLLKGSGKLVLLDKLLCRLKETGHRVLIFSQMVRMLDVLADYLQKRHFPFQRLDGSIKGEMRRQALDHFNAEGSQDFCFLLSTRAGGLGINLATADTVIIFDSDWNPQNDLQAQARAHRIGQKNQVNIYRLVTARSVEEQIVERAKQKMVLDHLVIQRMDTTGRTVLDKSGGSSSNTTPFNKDDLSAILKFGAEELFKDEQENDDELVCDIDEILRRAETRNEDPEMPGDDLLSAFKVASIVAFEEDPGDTAKDDTTGVDEDDTKDWDDIIPEDFRKVVENQERANQMEDLYLPPRRKAVANQSDSPQKKTGSGKKGNVADDSDGGGSDYEVGSDASGDETRPKKRGRPALKEKIPGFTDTEIRRFIRSYKKFPAPLMRLEAIACDAELQEKPLTDLKLIGEMLHNRCIKFFEEHKEELLAPKNDENGKMKRSRATFSLKLGAVAFNAKTVLQCEKELQPLNELLPNTAHERLNWTLNIKTKPANFDTDWGIEDDSKLLCGIYQYGIGSWEQMKMDPNLKLTEKILFNDSRKPQAKHLQTRAEYLLKIMKKNLDLRKGAERKQRTPRKPREIKGNSTASAMSILSSTVVSTPERKSRNLSESHGEELSQSEESGLPERAERKPRNRESISKVDTGEETQMNETNNETKKKSKRNAATSSGGNGNGSSLSKESSGSHKSSGKGKKSGTVDNTNKPMHFTANNEPRALEVLGDLDPNIFNECKEKMRPVKKSLKALDQPDLNQDQAKHTRDCLLTIGKQIDICLEDYKESERKKEWRSNLWYFVSKFTECDAKKLFKIYKNALKQNEEVMGISSPMKKPSHENQSENGEKVDKVSKKKKKERDRERDKDKERDKSKQNNYVSLYDKHKRMGSNPIDSPIKRKRDENDLNVSGVGGSFKRMNVDRSRDRHDDRKKHRDDYYTNDRRINSPTAPVNSRNMQRLPPIESNYLPDNRNLSPFIDPTSGGTGTTGDRWGHTRDRYSGGSIDYKRDRYDSYNRNDVRGGNGNNSYHRDRERDRRPDKRRYPNSHAPPLSYPGHYLPPNYYMGNGIIPPGSVPPSHGGPPYRSDPRYSHADWPRDYPPVDYRREYDRRPQT